MYKINKTNEEIEELLSKITFTERQIRIAVEFFGMLKSEATSPEEMQMIKEYTQRIHEM